MREARECTKKTQPRSKAVKPSSGEAGDTVKVYGSWMKGPDMVVKCFFWSDNLGKFYSLYDEGTMDNAGVIHCEVPEKDEGVEDDVKIAVRVYHKSTQTPQRNECFSHGGSTPDKFGEFGKFRYEENTAAMFPLTTYGRRETRACGPAPRERPPISPPRAANAFAKGLRRDRRR